MVKKKRKTRARPNELSPLKILSSAALALFVAVVLLRAWQGDDAYITWRTADNFLRGDGLTFNQGERVQAFTSPLWLLVGIVCQALTGEVYFSVLAVSVLVTVLALWRLAVELRGHPLGRTALGFTLAASATAVDFATSGLETPALALLAVTFGLSLLRGNERGVLISACLLFFCRPDTVVVTAVPILSMGFAAEDRRSFWKRAALYLSPTVLWVVFATFYFGSPVPNTALAKLNTELPRPALLAQGGRYLLDFVTHEPWSALIIVAALVLGFRSSERGLRPLAAALALNVLYVAWVGGDFMRGRFLLLPLWVSLVILSRRIGDVPHRVQVATAGLAAIAMLLPTSPLRDLGLEVNDDLDDNSGIVSERSFYAHQTGLLQVLSRAEKTEKLGHPTPPYSKGIECIQHRENGEITIMVVMAGYCGYFGGPTFTVYDWPALTVPFLAHVPHVASEHWRIGHFHRGNLPIYAARRLRPARFQDVGVEAAYQDVSLVTRGPLWSMKRLAAMVRVWDGTHGAAFKRLRREKSPYRH